jgi:hypothetical protein
MTSGYVYMLFPEVPERDAHGATAVLYADIRRTLQVPMVNLIYRHMAAIPECLPWAWGILREHYASAAMAAGIQSVVGSAQAQRSPWGPSLVCASDRERDDVREIAQYYNAGNAANLIALLALRLAGARGIPQAGGTAPEIVLAETTPAPRPIRRIETLEPALAAHIRRTAAAQDTQGLGIIPSMYLHLAGAPSVTSCVLSGVDSALANGTLEHDARRVRAAGLQAAAALAPRLTQRGDACPDPSLGRLFAALDTFTEHTIPEMLVVGGQIVKTLA